MDTAELVEVFKTYVRNSYFDAKKAHDCIFSKNRTDVIALAYLNKAISEHCCCDSLYYSQYDELSGHGYEEYSHQFEAFASELLENVETDHSHQWTDIEFEKLKEVLDNSLFALNN